MADRYIKEGLPHRFVSAEAAGGATQPGHSCVPSAGVQGRHLWSPQACCSTEVAVFEPTQVTINEMLSHWMP